MAKQAGTLLTPDFHPETDHCDHISRMLARISDKWTLLVVSVLGQGPRRFNALRRDVGEISQKVLAATLRDLEENGFVLRTVTPVAPWHWRKAGEAEVAMNGLDEEGRADAVDAQSATQVRRGALHKALDQMIHRGPDGPTEHDFVG